MPTYYPYEGQPISIIEAYAMGCVVISTNHSGIPYIFSDKNGFIVEKNSISSLVDLFLTILDKQSIFENIAFYNRDLALEKFRTFIFQEKIINTFIKFNSIN